ncbi:unnamed protein product [Amoebophrya sp. A120]|nr:unnamed protein product [Amoebophrya sp. A120]|eukprot:GSA120T00005200001.1
MTVDDARGHVEDKTTSVLVGREEVLRVLRTKLDSGTRRGILTRRTKTVDNLTGFTVVHSALGVFTCSGQQTGKLVMSTRVEDEELHGAEEHELATRTSESAQACDERASTTHRVGIQTLDALFGWKTGPRDSILFVKVDAEGHDMDILKGGRRLLQQKMVRYLLFEVNVSGEEDFVTFLHFLAAEVQYKFCYAVMPDALFPLNEQLFYDSYEQVFLQAQREEVHLDDHAGPEHLFRSDDQERQQLPSVLRAYFSMKVARAWNVICTYSATHARFLHAKHTRNQRAFLFLFRKPFGAETSSFKKTSDWWLRTGIGIEREERAHFAAVFPQAKIGNHGHGFARRSTLAFLHAFTNQAELDQPRTPWWRQTGDGGESASNTDRASAATPGEEEDELIQGVIKQSVVAGQEEHKDLVDIATAQIPLSDTTNVARQHWHLFEEGRYAIRSFLDVVTQRVPGKGLANLAARLCGSRFQPNYIVEPRIMKLGTVLDSKHVQGALLQKLTAVDISTNRNGENDFYHELARYLERRAHEAGFLDSLWVLCGAELWYVAAWRKRGSVGSFLSLMQLGWTTTTSVNRKTRSPDSSEDGASGSTNRETFGAGSRTQKTGSSAGLTHDSACLLLDRMGIVDLQDLFTKYVSPHDYEEWKTSAEKRGSFARRRQGGHDREKPGAARTKFSDFYADMWRDPVAMLQVHYNLTQAVHHVKTPKDILPYAVSEKARTLADEAVSRAYGFDADNDEGTFDDAEVRYRTNHLRYPMAAAHLAEEPREDTGPEELEESHAGRIFLWDFVEDAILKTDLRAVFWSAYFHGSQEAAD